MFNKTLLLNSQVVRSCSAGHTAHIRLITWLTFHKELWVLFVRKRGRSGSIILYLLLSWNLKLMVPPLILADCVHREQEYKLYWLSYMARCLAETVDVCQRHKCYGAPWPDVECQRGHSTSMSEAEHWSQRCSPVRWSCYVDFQRLLISVTSDGHESLAISW